MRRLTWLYFVCIIVVLFTSSCALNTPNSESVQPSTATGTSLLETLPALTAPPPSTQTPAPKPPSFSISGLTITPKEVMTGSPVTIELLVLNMGDLSGTYEVALYIDDAVEATEKVTLAGGASQKVTFTSSKVIPRSYLVSIANQIGTFTVLAPLQASTPTLIQIRPLPPLDAFMKGFNFADWMSITTPTPPAGVIAKPGPPRLGLYDPILTDQSLKNLAATGANWIALVVGVWQETISSTKIFRGPPRTASDAELQHVIDLAHSLGMRVMLTAPYIALANDPNYFEGYIGTKFTSEAQWQEWFASYREIINYYASFAEKSGVDILSVGHELGGVTHREADWRRIIQEVRQRFKGPITYASLSSSGPPPPHGEEKRITWWDAVDYIGVDVYYPLTYKNNPTVGELKTAWTERGYIALLENLSSRFNKPIIFTEFGYESKDGTGKQPANYKIVAPVDLQEQADCYQAALEVLWGRPWLGGIFWWQWFANTTIWPGGHKDTGFTPYGKPAEEVLKKFYLQK